MATFEKMIVKSSLSLQISDTLQKEIEQGVYGVGEQLPSEASLCRRFRTNRYTIRKSLDRLVQIGLISSHQGVGYFVSEKPLEFRYAVSSVTRYSSIIERLGRTPRVKVIQRDKIVPSLSVRDALKLGPHEEVYKLEMVRYADDIATTLSETYLPVRIFPGFMQQSSSFTSLYSMLEERYGIMPQRIRSIFQALIPTAREAAYLGISAGTPLIQIESIVCDQNKRPIELTFAKYRGDICRVSIDL